jgi:hypothetical protein
MLFVHKVKRIAVRNHPAPNADGEPEKFCGLDAVKVYGLNS